MEAVTKAATLTAMMAAVMAAMVAEKLAAGAGVMMVRVTGKWEVMVMMKSVMVLVVVLTCARGVGSKNVAQRH